jgi:ABC-type tungstate transport system permease subunit
MGPQRRARARHDRARLFFPKQQKAIGVLRQAFIDWLISREGKKAIAGFKIEGPAALRPQF